MRTVLKVEHHVQDRHVRSRFIRPGNHYFTVGSARDARLRLLGPEVAGVHAVIEWVDNHWQISDLGSSSGTWINRDAVLTQRVDRPMTIHIGPHELRLTPIAKSLDLFHGNRGSIAEASSGELLQEIVIRRNGHILNVEFTPAHQSYRYLHGVKVHLLTPAKSAQWEYDEFAEVLIQKRLIKGSKGQDFAASAAGEILNRENRNAFVGAVGVFVAFMVILQLAPSDNSKDLESVKQSDSKFARMIFDSKVVKKQREKAEKIGKMIQVKSQPAQKSSAAPAASKVTTPKVAANSPAVASAIKNIRTTGLSKLIGKISKRVGNNSNLIVSQGVSADERESGRAVASLGTVDTKGGKGQLGKVTISGVSTSGVGGGAGAGLKGVGGLSLGKVGAGEVGVIEEETDVEGGLDKEVIAAYIKTQLGQIRYCYERQLSATPNLYGKIHVKFTIASDGRVVQQEIGLTTLQNAMVEGCILRRVATWKFPEPKGGTMVVVTYPFLFKSHR